MRFWRHSIILLALDSNVTTCYRWKYHNTVGTTNLMTPNKTMWRINSVVSRFTVDNVDGQSSTLLKFLKSFQEPNIMGRFWWRGRLGTRELQLPTCNWMHDYNYFTFFWEMSTTDVSEGSSAHFLDHIFTREVVILKPPWCCFKKSRHHTRKCSNISQSWNNGTVSHGTIIQ